jgi:hypothetical protein
MLDNKEVLVTQGASMLPLFLALYFGDSVVIGLVLYFIIGLPTELIWIFAIVKLVRRVRGYWVGSTKS